MTTIDVHAHFIPDTYRKALSEAGIGLGELGFPLPPWSVDSRLADVDRDGIATGILSLPSPSLQFWHGADAVKLARRLNDELAAIVRDHPKRFGGFATLPMPDVPASIKELSCAFDELKLDGVVFMTNYGGMYLGDPHFAQVLDELHHRRAVAFVHPTHSLGALQLSLGHPPSLIEFPFDTTRTIVSLLDSDTIGRYPDLRFIASHGGGTLPFVAQCLEAVVPRDRDEDPVERAEKIREQIATLYFDLAGVAHTVHERRKHRRSEAKHSRLRGISNEQRDMIEPARPARFSPDSQRHPPRPEPTYERYAKGIGRARSEKLRHYGESDLDSDLRRTPN